MEILISPYHAFGAENNILPSRVEMDDELHNEIIDIHNRVDLFDPYAITVGGCLRDTIFNKPISDIDVYLNARFHYTEAVTRDLFERMGFIVDKINDNKNGFYGKNDRIQSVVSCHLAGFKYPVQLVVLTPNYSTFFEVRKFDVNISQMWAKPFLKKKVLQAINLEPAALAFAKDAKLGITNKELGFDDPYVQKIKAKYAEFEWKEREPLW